MKESENTGRLIPLDADGANAREFCEAFKALSAHPAFQRILTRVRDRLAEVDIENRRRGGENQYTEAQAWQWFLAVARKSESGPDSKTIELQT